LAQNAANGMRQAHDKVWGNGRLTDGAANAVCSKIFSSHSY
jgi:hypothetical protein